MLLCYCCAMHRAVRAMVWWAGKAYLWVPRTAFSLRLAGFLAAMLLLNVLIWVGVRR